MPILNTKYNTIPKIYSDFIQNSFSNPYIYQGEDLNFLRDNKILTCKPEDVLYEENNKVYIKKIYRESKAEFLLHPFTACGSVANKFNDENNTNELYRYKKPIVPEGCLPQSQIQIQKQIQKQVHVPVSLYTMNKASLSINSNNLHNNDKSWNNMSDRKSKHGKSKQENSSIKANSGVDIKHNSYARHLGKLKSQNLKTEPVSSNLVMPLRGNKVRKFGISNCVRSC